MKLKLINQNNVLIQQFNIDKENLESFLMKTFSTLSTKSINFLTKNIPDSDYSLSVSIPGTKYKIYKYED